MWVAIGLLVIVGVYLIAIFNRLVRYRNAADNALSQIEVQLQRRYDLIGNLQSVAERFIQHERETLTEIARLRRDIGSVGLLQDFSKVSQVNQQLSTLLAVFSARVEAYPVLKTDNVLASLQEELKSTENRVAFARQHYNDAVNVFNDALEVFPNYLLGNLLGWQEKPFWR
ncbi:LemA family protein [Suttonella ornithocola]|uniref:LemA family n=1 Tax=Suttonella ornithocola TaxID=279832 RepID=A0A380MW12_9GAMM|nr:LemA family protein [Suttonella ornithocola]SUO95587.1 LemA family [Suttonella ornithocola]